MNPILKFLLPAFLGISVTLTSHADVLLHDVEGNQTSFASLKGKWVLINYWAQWCQTCVAEIPELNAFYKKYKKDKVVLYGVNYDAPPLFEQKSLIKKLNINYPNLIQDPASQLHLDDIVGVPVTFVFNPEGRLVDTLYGGQSVKDLEKVVKL